jgi:hypothetical protein
VARIHVGWTSYASCGPTTSDRNLFAIALAASGLYSWVGGSADSLAGTPPSSNIRSKPPGVTTTRARALSDSTLKACGTRRGPQTQVPGPATNSSSPWRMRIWPSRTYRASSSRLWTGGRPEPVVEGSVDDAETVRSRRAGVSADVQQALALDELHASRRREAGLSLPAARVSHKGGGAVRWV